MGGCGLERDRGGGDCDELGLDFSGFIKHGKIRDWLNDRYQIGVCFVESSCRKCSWFDPRRGITLLFVGKFVILL